MKYIRFTPHSTSESQVYSVIMNDDDKGVAEVTQGTNKDKDKDNDEMRHLLVRASP